MFRAPARHLFISFGSHSDVIVSSPLRHFCYEPPSATFVSNLCKSCLFPATTCHLCFKPPYAIFPSSPCPPSLFRAPSAIFLSDPLLPSLIQTSVGHLCFQPPWPSLFRAPIRHLGRQSWRSRPSAPDRRSHVAQKTRPWSHRRGAAQSGEAFPAALDMMIVARSCCFESPGSGLRCCCLVSRSAASGTGAGPPG